MYPQVAKELSTENGWSTALPKVLSSHSKTATSNTLKALNAIRSRLNALIAAKSLPNKLMTKVLAINRNISVEKSNINNLMDVSNFYTFIVARFV